MLQRCINFISVDLVERLGWDVLAWRRDYRQLAPRNRNIYILVTVKLSSKLANLPHPGLTCIFSPVYTGQKAH